MRPSSRSALVLAALALLGCSPGTAAFSEADRTAIADTLRQLTQSFAQSANALNPDGALALFSSDPAMTWANDGVVLTISHDSLASLYRHVYRGWRRLDFTWDSLRVAVLSPDAGVVTAAGHFAVTDTADQTARRRVAGTYVFFRRGTKWELLHGHASHVAE